jgi:hypothetical protein
VVSASPLLPGCSANHFQGVTDSQVLREGDKFQCHQALGGSVGAHPREHFHNLGSTSGFPQAGLTLVVEFLENVRFQLRVIRQLGGVGVLLDCSRSLDQVGNFGRLQPVQLAEPGAHNQRGFVSDESLEREPIPGRLAGMVGFAAPPVWLAYSQIGTKMVPVPIRRTRALTRGWSLPSSAGRKMTRMGVLDEAVEFVFVMFPLQQLADELSLLIEPTITRDAMFTRSVVDRALNDARVERRAR